MTDTCSSVYPRPDLNGWPKKPAHNHVLQDGDALHSFPFSLPFFHFITFFDSLCLSTFLVLFFSFLFLRAKAARPTALARLLYRVLAVAILSVRLSVCPSVTRVDQSKTVQARITKSSPSAAWKTLVLGSVKLFINSKAVTPSESTK